MSVNFWVCNPPQLFKQSVLMRWDKLRTEHGLLLLNDDVLWCKKSWGDLRDWYIKIKRPVDDPFNYYTGKSNICIDHRVIKLYYFSIFITKLLCKASHFIAQTQCINHCKQISMWHRAEVILVTLWKTFLHLPREPLELSGSNWFPSRHRCLHSRHLNMWSRLSHRPDRG